MQRHDFLITHSREDARNDRKWSHYRLHNFNMSGGRFSSPDWFASFAPTDEDFSDEHSEPPSLDQVTSDPSAKLLYLEAMRSLERDRLQPTWGRIQQMGEKDYEGLMVAFKELRHTLPVIPVTVLEEFVGFVEQIVGEVAYVTLTTNTGESLYGEYAASEMKAKGIMERRRFKCRTIDTGTHVKFDLEPIPDRHISEERERAILENLRNELGDNDGPQDDY